MVWWRGAAVGAPSNRSAQLVALVLAEAARAGYWCMQGLEGAFHLPRALPQGSAGADGEREGGGSTEGRSAARPC